MVGIYSAADKVAFAFHFVVLYIMQICNLTGIILRDDDLSFALYMPTTVFEGDILAGNMALIAGDCFSLTRFDHTVAFQYEVRSEEHCNIL